jgi:hypothetical protein
LQNNNCNPTGFDSQLSYEKEQETEKRTIHYNICVKYVGDCDGTIYPGQVKTCTIENYIYGGDFTNFNSEVATTAGTTSQQSNNTLTTIPSNSTSQQSNNTLTTMPTTAPTQSNSNVVGVPQSSNVVAGVQNTLSSHPPHPSSN